MYVRLHQIALATNGGNVLSRVFQGLTADWHDVHVQPSWHGQQEEDLEANQCQLLNQRKAPRYTASQHAVWRCIHGPKAEEIGII